MRIYSHLFVFQPKDEETPTSEILGSPRADFLPPPFSISTLLPDGESVWERELQREGCEIASRIHSHFCLLFNPKRRTGVVTSRRPP